MTTMLLLELFLLAGSGLAQGVQPSSGAFPYPLKQYLGLSDTQVSQIIRINGDYREFLAAKEARIGEIQVEIAMESGRDRIDPVALGTRYAEIETIRREIAAETTRHRGKLREILSDPQRAKLQELEEAARLQPLVGQAQCENLLVLPPDKSCIPTAPAGRIVPLIPPGARLPVK